MNAAAVKAIPEPRRHGGAAVGTAVVACVVFVIPGAAAMLEFDRVLVARGEVWRLITSHWTHWTAEHLVWDSLVFCTLLPLALSVSRRRTVMLLAAGSAAIPLGVWLLRPERATYRGLSGLDSALFVFVALEWFIQATRSRDRLGMLVLGGALSGFAGKTGFEYLTGQSVFVASMGAHVAAVPLAHLIGAVLAVVAVCLRRLGRRPPRYPQTSRPHPCQALPTAAPRAGHAR